MLIDVKDFLKRNGFSFYKAVDRGALWALGEHRVMVQRDYTHKPYDLKLLREAVFRAVELHKHAKAKEGAEFHKEVQKAQERGLQLQEQDKKERADVVRPSTPEEHRAAQIAAAASMRDDAPEVAPVVPATTEATGEEVKKSKAGMKKFSGDERLYVFGRLRYMIESGMDDDKIASALRLEGVRKPNGTMLNSAWVRVNRTNWKTNPASQKKYDVVEHGRGMAVVPKPPLPKADQPKADPTRISLSPRPGNSRRLPTYVLAILKAPDDELSADDKVRMILAWAEGA